MALLRMIVQLAFLALAAGFLVTFLRMSIKDSKARKLSDNQDAKGQASKEV